MSERMKNTWFFFIPYFLLVGVGLSYFLFNDHGDLVLWFINHQTEALSLFFTYWTHTGSWIFILIVVSFTLIFKFRYGLILILVMSTQGLILALMKQVLFKDTPRPQAFFESRGLLGLIEGVRIQDFNSFPSGHTMSAFAMATFMALLLQKKRYSGVLLAGAALTGLSRVYLGQHFLIDIIVGSLIGTMVSVLFFFIFERYLHQERYDQKDRPDDDLQKMDLGTDDVTREV